MNKNFNINEIINRGFIENFLILLNLDILKIICIDIIPIKVRYAAEEKERKINKAMIGINI